MDLWTPGEGVVGGVLEGVPEAWKPGIEAWKGTTLKLEPNLGAVRCVAVRFVGYTVHCIIVLILGSRSFWMARTEESCFPVLTYLGRGDAFESRWTKAVLVLVTPWLWRDCVPSLPRAAMVSGRDVYGGRHLIGIYLRHRILLASWDFYLRNGGYL